MWVHFRHINSKSFPIIWGTFQSNEFWLLQSLCKIWESIGTPIPQVGAHLEGWGSFLHTFPHSQENEMRLLTSFLARTFASLSLGHELKARVATLYLMWFYDYDWFPWSFSVGLGMWATSFFVQVGDTYGYGEFDNCLASRYSSVCYNSWKRLLTLGS
jgi:hypothetical protein